VRRQAMRASRQGTVLKKEPTPGWGEK